MSKRPPKRQLGAKSSGPPRTWDYQAVWDFMAREIKAAIESETGESYTSIAKRCAQALRPDLDSSKVLRSVIKICNDQSVPKDLKDLIKIYSKPTKAKVDPEKVAKFYAAVIKVLRAGETTKITEAMRLAVKRDEFLKYSPVSRPAVNDYLKKNAPALLESLQSQKGGVSESERDTGNAFLVLLRTGMVRLNVIEASEILAALEFKASAEARRKNQSLKASSIKVTIYKSGAIHEHTPAERKAIGKKRFQSTEYYQNIGRAELIEEVLQRAAEPNGTLDKINGYHEVEITFDDIAKALQLSAAEKEHFEPEYARFCAESEQEL